MTRLARVSALIKVELSRIIRERINDSRIGFISIVDIELSKDLAYAKVFYSQIGTEKEKQETLKGLLAAKRFLKGELGKVLHLKTIPNLRFFLDDSIERGSNMLEKMKKLD